MACPRPRTPDVTRCQHIASGDSCPAIKALDTPPHLKIFQNWFHQHIIYLPLFAAISSHSSMTDVNVLFKEETQGTHLIICSWASAGWLLCLAWRQGQWADQICYVSSLVMKSSSRLGSYNQGIMSPLFRRHLYVHNLWYTEHLQATQRYTCKKVSNLPL